MRIERAQDGARVTLEAEEDLFTILRSDALTDYGRSVTAVEEENDDLLRKRKHLWWIGPGDTIFLRKKKSESHADADSGWRHRFRLRRYPKRIDVYLGFMDEEVNARLAKIIEIEDNKDRGRPVILIERGEVEGGKKILEWEAGNYPVDEKRTKIIHVSPVKGVPEGESQAPEDILARAMSVFMETDLEQDLAWLARGLPVKRYFDLIKLLQHRGLGDPKTNLPKNVGIFLKAKKPAEAAPAQPAEAAQVDQARKALISIVRFDVGVDTEAPIVVIRTPEMGLQPSLMCPYIAFLFKALSAASSELAALEVKRPEAKTDEWVVYGPKEGGGGKQGSGTVRDEGSTKKMMHRLWEWPLRVSQFGAHGSTSEKYPPGSTITIVASLFIGVEVASEVTVKAVRTDEAAKGGARGPFEFRFEQSPDSTESAPHWVARGATLKEEKDSGLQLGFKGEETAINAYAVISLCTPAGVYDFLREPIESEEQAKALLAGYTPKALDTTKGFDRIKVAQDVAMEIFRTQGEGHHELLKLKGHALEKDSPFFDHEKDVPGGEPTLKQVIDRISGIYKDRFFYHHDANNPGVVSATGSFFGSDEDKKACDALGIIGFNMEDYHVLRVLRSALAKGVSPKSDYPIILGWRVDRINCDPKIIPKAIIAKFQAFAKDPRSLMTIDDYVKAIIWGLRGVRREDILANDALKEAMRWRFIDEAYVSKIEAKQLFWSFVHKKDAAIDDMNTFWVPDPFCIEIATDFVAQLADEKKGPKKSIAGNPVQDEVVLKNTENLAKKIDEAWQREKGGNKSLHDLLTNSETKSAIENLMRDLCQNYGFDSQQKVKTWLRPGKWDQDRIKAPTLQDAADQFTGKAIDRAFYKSSNIMALQTMADFFLWEGGDAGTRIPSIGNMDASR